MIIREATLDDVPALVQLAGGDFEDNPQWHNLTFSAENTARTLVHRIMEENSCILLAQSDAICGAVSLTTDNRLTDELIGYEEMFYIHRDYRKTRSAILLARAYVNKLLEMGAKKIYTSSTAGFGAETYAKLMQRMGFKTIENGVFLVYE